MEQNETYQAQVHIQLHHQEIQIRMTDQVERGSELEEH